MSNNKGPAGWHVCLYYVRGTMTGALILYSVYKSEAQVQPVCYIEKNFRYNIVIVNEEQVQQSFMNQICIHKRFVVLDSNRRHFMALHDGLWSHIVWYRKRLA